MELLQKGGTQFLDGALKFFILKVEQMFFRKKVLPLVNIKTQAPLLP